MVLPSFFKMRKNAIFCWCPRFLRFFISFFNAVEKLKQAALTLVKCFCFKFWNSLRRVQAVSMLVWAFWKTKTGINNFNCFLCELIESKFGSSLYFLHLSWTLTFAKSIWKNLSRNKKKCQSCPVLLMFRVLCAVGGLLNRNLKV